LAIPEGQQADVRIDDSLGFRTGSLVAATAHASRDALALRAEDPALFTRISEVSVASDALAVTDRVSRARLLLPGDPEDVSRAAAAWRAWIALAPDLGRRGLPVDAADLRFEGRIVLNAPPEFLGRGKT